MLKIFHSIKYFVLSISLISLLLCNNFLFAENEEGRPASETSGPAVGVGMGYQSAMLGGQIAYYYKAGSILSLVPYAGAGYYPVKDNTGAGGFAVGSLIAIGQRHRFFLDFSYGLSAVEYTENSITGDVFNLRTVYGITGAAGWEFLADCGIFFRLSLGVNYLTEKIDVVNESRTSATFNIATGYKMF